MTNKELIQAVVEQYNIARLSHREYRADHIKRGRNHSISSITEDIFAMFLSSRLNQSGVEYWVDYPVSYKHQSSTKTKTIYADIAIVAQTDTGSEIRSIIDLKMDLGWKRDLANYLSGVVSVIQELREIGKVSYKKVDELGLKSRTTEDVKVSSKLNWYVVIISNQNIQEFNYGRNVTLASSAEYANYLKLCSLTRGVHPNRGKTENIQIDNDQINLLLDDLKADLS